MPTEPNPRRCPDASARSTPCAASTCSGSSAVTARPGLEQVVFRHAGQLGFTGAVKEWLGHLGEAHELWPRDSVARPINS